MAAKTSIYFRIPMLVGNATVTSFWANVEDVGIILTHVCIICGCAVEANTEPEFIQSWADIADIKLQLVQDGVYMSNLQGMIMC